MKKITKNSGFTTVELLITLFVAAAFLTSGYQLFNAIIEDGGTTRAQINASNIAYDYIQQYKSSVANPCTNSKPIDNQPITASGISNVTVTVAISCLTKFSGLAADYYNNMTLTGVPTVHQIEQTVYHDWGVGSPVVGISSDNFSVSWSGYLTAPVTGNYTFYVTSDDGEQLYVNNSLIVDKWVDQGTTTVSGNISLNANQTVPLVYKMYENTGGAYARLDWAIPGGAQVVIPSTALSCNPTQSISKIQATVKYNSPQQTVNQAIYVNE